MRKHLKYLSYVIRHKYWVFVAGLQTGASWWRLLIHDWSKLTPFEWGPYVEFFYGEKPAPENMQDATLARWQEKMSARKLAFDRAWLHHQHWNLHHWQYWILRNDSGVIDHLPMPDQYVREMVADWFGAGRAINGKWDAWGWYHKNKSKIELHSQTRYEVEKLILEVSLRMGVPTNLTEMNLA